MTEGNGGSMAKINPEELAAVSGGAGADTLKIRIIDMHGNVSFHEVTPETTIYILKWLWQGGTAEDERYVPYIRLVYKGKELDNSRTVASYNIPGGETLHAIFKMH